MTCRGQCKGLALSFSVISREEPEGDSELCCWFNIVSTTIAGQDDGLTEITKHRGQLALSQDIRGQVSSDDVCGPNTGMRKH
jgi:hypothetical protein